MYVKKPSRFGRFLRKAFFFALFTIFTLGAGTTLYLRWQYGELGRDLDAERERARRNGIWLDPQEFMRAVPAERNAADDIRAAIAKIEATPRKEQSAALKLARDLADGGKPLTPGEGWSSLLAMQAEVLPLAEKAAAKPDCDFGRDWSHPIEMTFPEYARFRDLGRLLCARSLQRANAGEFDAAFRDLDTALKIAEHSGREPTLIGALVRIAGRAVVMKTAEREVAMMPKGAHGATVILDRILPTLKSEHDPLFALRGEPYFGAYLARNIGQYMDEFGKITGQASFGEEEPFHWEKFLFLPPLQDPERVGAAYETRLLKYWNDAFEKARHQGWRAAEMGRELDLSGRALAEENVLTKAFLSVILPVFSGFGDAEATDEARASLVRAARDVFAFQNRTGKFPRELSEASKIADPFTGEALKYRRTEGGFVVYSVGRDGVDNGGRRQERSSRPGEGDRQFDIVFEYGGASAQLAADH